MANAYMDKIEAFVRANEENVIRDIKRLVDIPSVAGTPEPGAPNGAGPAAALKEALALAAEMGLATGEFEGHMGWAELPGSTDKQIATITHMDVVPAGNGWTGDPFNMRVQDGWLIGRGVADDKGPGVLCLYALTASRPSFRAMQSGFRAALPLQMPSTPAMSSRSDACISPSEPSSEGMRPCAWKDRDPNCRPVRSESRPSVLSS